MSMMEKFILRTIAIFGFNIVAEGLLIIGFWNGLGSISGEISFYFTFHSTIGLAIINAILLCIIRNKGYFWYSFAAVMCLHHVGFIIDALLAVTFQSGFPSHISRGVPYTMLDGFRDAFPRFYMIDVPVILALFAIAWLILRRTGKRSCKIDV